MTTEEKAKAYDEALERVKKQRADYQKELDKTDKNSQLAGLLRAGISAIDMAFPELKESEDERIRKKLIEIIGYFRSRGIDQQLCEEFLTYLEKQKDLNKMIVVSPEVWDNAISEAYENGKKDGEKQKEILHISETCKENANSFTDSVIEVRSFQRGLEEGKRQEQEKQKEQPITANDLDEEIHRFFDDCIDVHEVKLYGNISERVIPVDCYELTARHFAEWGEKQKEQKPEQYSPLCDTIKDKIREYIANHFIADTVVKTDIKSIVKAMEEGVRLGKEEQKPVDYDHEMWKNCEANFEGGKKEVIEHPEKYGLQKPAEWSKEDEKRVKQLIYDTEAIRAGYEKRKESLGDDFNDELIKDCDEQINWLKSLRPSWKPNDKDEERLIKTSIVFLKDFADMGYENAVECIDWLKSKLNGNTCK